MSTKKQGRLVPTFGGKARFLSLFVALVTILGAFVAFAPAASATPLLKAGGDQVNTVITLPTIEVSCVDGTASGMLTSPLLPEDSGSEGLYGPNWDNGAPANELVISVSIAHNAPFAFPSVLPQYWSYTGVDIDGTQTVTFKYVCGDSGGGGTTPPPADPGSGTTPGNVSRIAGANRYATAAAVAKLFGTASAIVIANGETAKQGVDALSANYLAGRVGAPILLTQATKTDSGTLSAAKTVLKGSSNPTIYVMGGTDSVSDAVVRQFKAAAASVSTGTVVVKRVAGANRYATSALAATTPGAVENSLSLSAEGDVLAKTAILASGQVNADALAAGALSYAWGIPVLLTPGKMAQQVTYDAVKELGISQLIVLGGTDRVSQAVVSHLGDAGVIAVKRIAGSDRYDTAAQLYTYAVDALRDNSGDHYGVNGDTVYLANGTTGFPDALSAGPLVGKNGDVLLTTAPTKLGASALSFIKTHSQFTSVVGLGSASTVSNSVLSTAGKAVG